VIQQADTPELIGPVAPEVRKRELLSAYMHQRWVWTRDQETEYELIDYPCGRRGKARIACCRRNSAAVRREGWSHSLGPRFSYTRSDGARVCPDFEIGKSGNAMLFHIRLGWIMRPPTSFIGRTHEEWLELADKWLPLAEEGSPA